MDEWKEDSYLKYHGILGQKWGVRRFQNEDGSLTEAGRDRYGNESSGESRRGFHSRGTRIRDGVASINLGNDRTYQRTRDVGGTSITWSSPVGVDYSSDFYEAISKRQEFVESDWFAVMLSLRGEQEAEKYDEYLKKRESSLDSSINSATKRLSDTERQLLELNSLPPYKRRLKQQEINSLKKKIDDQKKAISLAREQRNQITVARSSTYKLIRDLRNGTAYNDSNFQAAVSNAQQAFAENPYTDADLATIFKQYSSNK